MARNIPSPSIRAPKSVPMPRFGTNANRDRTTQLRPPRLKPLSMGTRDYAKGELSAEAPPNPFGGGFGRTGLSGET